MNNFNYYTFRVDAATKKVTQEIKFYEECEFADFVSVKEYVQYLKNRLGLNRIDISGIRYDSFGSRHLMERFDMKEHCGEKIDSSIYSKPWNKLREFHKTIKIHQFVESLDYHKSISDTKIAKNQQMLKDELCAGLKTKKYNKNKSVIVYDIEKMEITSISALCYNKTKKMYEIDWDM